MDGQSNRPRYSTRGPSRSAQLRSRRAPRPQGGLGHLGHHPPGTGLGLPLHCPGLADGGVVQGSRFHHEGFLAGTQLFQESGGARVHFQHLLARGRGVRDEDRLGVGLARVDHIGAAAVEEARIAAKALLTRFDLADKADQYPDRLSGGQQQRVAIIRSLAVNPRLLLLDEITSALDPVLVNEVLSIVRDLKHDGMTMVLATHEMGFATQVADEVCFLHGGRILEWGRPEEILEAPKRSETQDFLRRVHEAGRL